MLLGCNYSHKNGKVVAIDINFMSHIYYTRLTSIKRKAYIHVHHKKKEKITRRRVQLIDFGTEIELLCWRLKYIWYFKLFIGYESDTSGKPRKK